MGDGFYRSKDPTNSFSTEGELCWNNTKYRIRVGLTDIFIRLYSTFCNASAKCSTKWCLFSLALLNYTIMVALFRGRFELYLFVITVFRLYVIYSMVGYWWWWWLNVTVSNCWVFRCVTRGKHWSISTSTDPFCCLMAVSRPDKDCILRWSRSGPGSVHLFMCCILQCYFTNYREIIGKFLRHENLSPYGCHIQCESKKSPMMFSDICSQTVENF